MCELEARHWSLYNVGMSLSLLSLSRHRIPEAEPQSHQRQISIRFGARHINFDNIGSLDAYNLSNARILIGPIDVF